jgi:polyhydroxyalkanoate synthesis regulator protein
MATMAMAGREMSEMRSTGADAGRRSPSVGERNRELFEKQQSRRRGPTPEMFFSKHIDNTRIVKADDPERRREMRSFTIAMTMFFMLTMVYVWQHFSAIEVGYKVEAQKTQVERGAVERPEPHRHDCQAAWPGAADARTGRSPQWSGW